MRLLEWWFRGRRRRTPEAMGEIVVTVTADCSGFAQAMQGAARASRRLALQLVLVDVRREARQQVRDGVAAAHPWLRLPPPPARPSRHDSGPAVDVVKRGGTIRQSLEVFEQDQADGRLIRRAILGDPT